MKRYTSTKYFEPIITKTLNGLGEIITVKVGDQNTNKTPSHEEFDFGSNHCTYDTQYTAYAILFVPKNGSLIKNINITCNNGHSSTWGWSDELQSSEPEEDYRDTFYNIPTSVSFNWTQDWSDNVSGPGIGASLILKHGKYYGAFCIGGYVVGEDSRTELPINPTEDDEKYVYLSNETNNPTINIEVIGEKDYIGEPTVFGDESDVEKLVFFAYCYRGNYYNREYDPEYVYTRIYRKTTEKKTYSNIVTFSEPYDVNGYDIPSEIGQMSLIPTTRKSSLEQEPSTTDELEIIWDSRSASRPNIRHILLYVNSFFIIFRSSNDLTKDTSISRPHMKCIVPKMDFDYEHPMDENMRYLQNLDYFDIGKMYDNMMIQDKDTEYSVDSSISWNEWNNTHTDINGVAYHQIQDVIGSTIPVEHRWVLLTNGITGLYEIVKYIDLTKDSQKTIRNLVRVLSQENLYEEVSNDDEYTKNNMRFTKYWLNCTASGRYYCFYHTKSMGKLEIQNQYMYPIFKPWAASVLVLHCKDLYNNGNSSVLGIDIEHNGHYLDIVNRLHANGINNEYIKEIRIQTLDGQDKIKCKLKDFSHTVSPFLVEAFLTHGCRILYDNVNDQNYPSNGVSSIYACENEIVVDGRNVWDSKNVLSLNCNALCKLHNVIHLWNSRNHLDRSDTCLYVASNCCYGSGILYEWCTSENNSSIVNSACNATGLLDVYNTCCLFVAISTHPGIGGCSIYSVTNDYGRKYLNHVTSSANINYKQVIDGYNAKVKGDRTILINYIKDLFNDYYDILGECVANELNRNEWKEMKQYVKNELDNMGLSAFCINTSHSKSSWQSNRSDCFFDSSNKQYWKGSGFIQYIKYLKNRILLVDKRSRISFSGGNAESNILAYFITPNYPSNEVCIELLDYMGIRIFPNIKTIDLEYLKLINETNSSTELTEGEKQSERNTLATKYNNRKKFNELINAGLSQQDIESLPDVSDFLENTKELRAKLKWCREHPNFDEKVPELTTFFLQLCYYNMFSYFDTVHFNIDPVIDSDVLTCHPLMVGCGKLYSNDTKFLDYPDLNMKKRLTSDNDLAYLNQVSNTLITQYLIQ